MATKKKKVIKEVEVEEVEVEVEVPTQAEVAQAKEDNKTSMVATRDELQALLKRLQDEGIVNIGVLENKIAKLNEDILKA